MGAGHGRGAWARGMGAGHGRRVGVVASPKVVRSAPPLLELDAVCVEDECWRGSGGDECLIEDLRDGGGMA